MEHAFEYVAVTENEIDECLAMHEEWNRHRETTAAFTRPRSSR
jgi:hypothetical protein